ncbi:type I-F CRISPR-associated protein Csy3 [Pectinatus frisingensis]|uniref:type I-F CRISPR-associated protein Csy3 n=1 Tax=Pectinatus frisingensis TaxID=865 RepID=UPI0018C65A48|nr:type I-F CRISPR-associated protein Csy3 [Pectinatus frisingensis]
MAKKNSFMASVLAFEKKIVVSDGYMYGTTWNDRLKEASPLKLAEKSVRGTISNRLKDTIKNDPAKLNAEVEKANLQRVDSCALGISQDTLKLSFSIKILSGIEQPSACNSVEFAQKYYDIAKKYIYDNDFRELARRYAMNIANGRFLWRNRVGAEKIEIVVSVDNHKWIFDAYKYSLKDFEESNDINELADLIAQTLSGKREYSFINIEAYVLSGKAQDVYPSEELVLDKSNDNKKGKKSKILYQVNDTAAMHSQKLSNAIRTIDTWYPEFGSERTVPISIETYGTVSNLGKAYRAPSDKVDFYTLFDKYVVEGDLEKQEDKDYVMAVLVRGGVFGQSSKE